MAAFAAGALVGLGIGITLAGIQACRTCYAQIQQGQGGYVFTWRQI